MKGFGRSRAWAIAFSFVMIAAVLFVAAAAPWISPYSFEEQSIEHRLERPSREHWMGTDSLGRDLMSRVFWGARGSLAVGFATAALCLLIGTVVGSIAGYRGGWIDSILMRFVDIIYTFPSLLFAILVTVWIGQGLSAIVIALSFTGWANLARVVRSQVLQVRERLHVEAARSLGASPLRIVKSHILPLSWGPILVTVTAQTSGAILSESFLSFIGLGIRPPNASWGTLANEGWRGMYSHPHLILFPGVFLFGTLIALQFLGDWWSDRINENQLGDFKGIMIH